MVIGDEGGNCSGSLGFTGQVSHEVATRAISEEIPLRDRPSNPQDYAGLRLFAIFPEVSRYYRLTDSHQYLTDSQ